MCHLLFTYGTCGCPPAPTWPHVVLCLDAKRWEPVRACGKGNRTARIAYTSRPCSMCVQREREAYKEERKAYMKAKERRTYFSNLRRKRAENP
jgi:hypothetical protein